MPCGCHGRDLWERPVGAAHGRDVIHAGTLPGMRLVFCVRHTAV